MPKLTIDDKEVDIYAGATILDAARKLGIEVPTMCFRQGYRASTSCMLCAVKVEGLNRLVPACGAIAQEGMKVDTACEEVRLARIGALELLLSDHLGDCMGPCQVVCPCRMNIPLMIRQIRQGELESAIATIKKDIALPAVLGRICPKPCEKVCRRGEIDDAISICLLKRFVADVDLQSSTPYQPKCMPVNGKKIAIGGGGPSGLSAAYFLLQKGYECTVFDQNNRLGGMLWTEQLRERLPAEVVEKEVALIEKLGMRFESRKKIGSAVSIAELREDFDAVYIGIGELKEGDEKRLGVKTASGCIVVDRQSYKTSLEGVFAGGDAVRKKRLTVRAVADGKEAAVCIDQYLSGKKLKRTVKEFNTRIGKITEHEKEAFLAGADRRGRVKPSNEQAGYNEQEAMGEAGRCLHCDCRKADNCKLRQYAQQYGARPARYKGQRRPFVQQVNHPEIIYEPGKCIDCGLCIEIASEEGEKFGLTFIGRGFDVQVAVPLGRSMAEALERAGRKCVEACPTGALAFKDSKRRTNPP